MEKIAITGGPCAGKTSSMDVLRSRLDYLGVPVVYVPEAATELILQGVAPWTCASMLDFQTRVIALQLEREAAAFERASASGAVAVICDRGICDSHAYLSDEDFARALEANGIDQTQALARYDAVFHLDSVAKDRPDDYTKQNNGARFENAEEAVAANERTIGAWAGHPAFHVIGNRASFAEKADELYGEISQLLGVADAGFPILVSACLLGMPCRYDGKSQPCPAVIQLQASCELVPVCPEQLGGLPTPRTPSEIQSDGRVVDQAGDDRTAAFEAGAREALRIAREHGCKRAILKSNSPSCGMGRVYDGSFSGTLVPGMGKTAALLDAAGIEVLSETDVERII